MYMDFHYYMIKVLAIKAGFSRNEAEDIAYASEYVDDALEFLPMKIVNPPAFAKELLLKDGRFDVVCTAHDEQTMLGGALLSGQERTYVPFHFVPRDGKSVPREEFDFRTSPNCATARGLIENAVNELKDAQGDLRSRKLIKLGIALHAYADTWAHKDFSGLFRPEENAVENVQVFEGGEWRDQTIDTLPAIVPETGHAKAHALPDSSHSRWRYYNGITREYFERNNPELYLEAAEMIYALLCQASGGENRWPEIKDKIKACIDHVPARPIWAENRVGINEKIQVYLRTFPEIFTGSFEQEEYDELLWKSHAMRPFRLDGENRKYLDFSDEIFQLRKLVAQWGAQIRTRAQHIVDNEKLQFLLNAAKNAAVGGASGVAAGVVDEAMKGIQDWFERYSSIQYEFTQQSVEANKWFYFHLEAEAQRAFVLKETHLRYERDDNQAPTSGVSGKLPDLKPQLTNVLINALERFVAAPSRNLRDRSHWMSVRVQNDTPCRIVWKGRYDDDFSAPNCSGRYWDRPDKYGDIHPSGHAVFTTCERNNAMTGCSGVAPFAIVLDNGKEIPFQIGFSNPVFEDTLHAVGKMGGEVVEAVANAPAQLFNKFSSLVEGAGLGSLGRVDTFELKVKNSPKCRVTFETDRQRTYEAMDDGSKAENSKECSMHGVNIRLTAYPGQEARVVVSRHG